MIVKIGDKLYDSNEIPIVVIFQENDLDYFYNLEGNSYRYLFYSKEKLDKNKVKSLMKIEIDPDHGA